MAPIWCMYVSALQLSLPELICSGQVSLLLCTRIWIWTAIDWGILRWPNQSLACMYYQATEIRSQWSCTLFETAALAKCDLVHRVYWHLNLGPCIKYSPGLGSDWSATLVSIYNSNGLTTLSCWADSSPLQRPRICSLGCILEMEEGASILIFSEFVPLHGHCQMCQDRSRHILHWVGDEAQPRTRGAGPLTLHAGTVDSYRLIELDLGDLCQFRI